jgi:predicted enzyme related to lactoylglutathione lyase
MGRVIHFEIHAGEPERAIKFYRELFGWEFTKWGGPQAYWLVKTGPDDKPGINGGLIQRRGGIDGQSVLAYVCTIDTPSVDDYVKKALALGGTVALPKMPIPGVGWLAYCKDTEGNIFGLMQADPKAG